MTDKNGKEEEQQAQQDENPVAWITELNPDVLAGLLAGVAKQAAEEDKRHPGSVKVVLPGGLVHMAEEFSRFMAAAGIHASHLDNPVGLLEHCFAIGVALLLAKMHQARHPAVMRSAIMFSLFKTLADKVATTAKERGIPPEQFTGLLQKVITDIGLAPGVVAVCRMSEDGDEPACQECERDQDACPLRQFLLKQQKSDGDGSVSVVQIPHDIVEQMKNDSGEQDADEGLPEVPTDRPGAS